MTDEQTDGSLILCGNVQSVTVRTQGYGICILRCL